MLVELLRARPSADVTVACAPGSPLERAVNAAGVATVPLTVPKRADFATAAGYTTALARSWADTTTAIRRTTPDVVHAFVPFALKATAPSTFVRRVPLVLSVHDVMAAGGRYPPASSRMTRHLASRTARSIVAVSCFTADTLLRLGYPAQRVVTVHNGIDPARVAAPATSRAERRAALGVADTDVLYACVGRLLSWKGQDVAIAALARLPASAHLVVLGSAFGDEDTTYAASLPDVARRAGVADRVHFVARTDDVAPWYAAADVVVVPSTDPDPFPTVVLEAGAAGRPVIVSALGGGREAIEDGATGIVAEPRPERMAEAMSRLADRAVARAMGDSARRHIADRFSVTAYRDAIESVWRDARGPSGRR
jgi:glycosyltransferase involved in cell wall biosynthesis